MALVPTESVENEHKLELPSVGFFRNRTSPEEKLFISSKSLHDELVCSGLDIVSFLSETLADSGIESSKLSLKKNVY